MLCSLALKAQTQLHIVKLQTQIYLQQNQQMTTVLVFYMTIFKRCIWYNYGGSNFSVVSRFSTRCALSISKTSTIALVFYYLYIDVVTNFAKSFGNDKLIKQFRNHMYENVHII